MLPVPVLARRRTGRTPPFCRYCINDAGHSVGTAFETRRAEKIFCIWRRTTSARTTTKSTAGRFLSGHCSPSPASVHRYSIALFDLFRDYNRTRTCVRSCVDKQGDLKYIRPFFRRNYLNEIICFKNYNGLTLMISGVGG